MQFSSLCHYIALALASSALVYAAPQTAVETPEPIESKSQKLVIAHYIVGNTYPYQVDDWKSAIKLAQSKGVDAFALDLGADSWGPARVADAYKASLGTTFKLMIMFDMGSLPCSKEQDGKVIRDLVTAYHGHSNQLLYNGKSLVSTFGGNFCNFGTQHMDDGWNNVLKTDLVPVHFVPAYFIEPPIFPSLKAIDGAFSWDSAWPMGNYDINSEYDDEYLQYLKGRSYMAGVSPWFFTHYGKDTFNKNLIYRGDSWLFVERWEGLIKYRNTIDLVQVISWNDYGESHYIGPINGAQPKSEAWTTGFDHQGFLDLMHYYIQAYKTGRYPDIQRDRIFMWGRLYPAQADAPDPIGKPLNFNFTQDYVWIIAMMEADGHFEAVCGPNKVSADLRQGVSKLKLPLTEDCSVQSAITRLGKKALQFNPAGYNFKKNPPTYNFNAFVAASD